MGQLLCRRAPTGARFRARPRIARLASPQSSRCHRPSALAVSPHQPTCLSADGRSGVCHGNFASPSVSWAHALSTMPPPLACLSRRRKHQRRSRARCRHSATRRCQTTCAVDLRWVASIGTVSMNPPLPSTSASVESRTGQGHVDEARRPAGRPYHPGPFCFVTVLVRVGLSPSQFRRTPRYTGDDGYLLEDRHEHSEH